jgi:hypothetical protein
MVWCRWLRGEGSESPHVVSYELLELGGVGSKDIALRFLLLQIMWMMPRDRTARLRLMALIVRLLACYWIVLGAWGIRYCFTPPSILDPGSPGRWIAFGVLGVLALLVALGLLSVGGNRPAHVLLMVPVFLVSIYYADVAYMHLWYGRFHAELWRALATTNLGGATILATVFLFVMRDKYRLPPVIKTDQ